MCAIAASQQWNACTQTGAPAGGATASCAGGVGAALVGGAGVGVVVVVAGAVVVVAGAVLSGGGGGTGVSCSVLHALASTERQKTNEARSMARRVRQIGAPNSKGPRPFPRPGALASAR